MPSLARAFRPLSIESLYGKHAGETVFVAGTSYSLDKMDLSGINGYTVIGINRAIRQFKCNYLSMSESEVFDAVKEEIEEQDPTLLLYETCAHVIRLKLRDRPYAVTRLEDRDGHKIGRRGVKGDFLWEALPPNHPYAKFYPDKRRILEPGGPQKDGLFLRSNSNCIYALEWAYRFVSNELMTPSKIVLVGIDMRKKDIKNPRSLTYTKNVNTLHRRDLSCRLPPPDRVLPHLRRFWEVLAEHNVELVNASVVDGPLDEFIPREPLARILENGRKNGHGIIQS